MSNFQVPVNKLSQQVPFFSSLSKFDNDIEIQEQRGKKNPNQTNKQNFCELRKWCRVLYIDKKLWRISEN